jgi:type IV pilus assembly protein PilE
LKPKVTHRSLVAESGRGFTLIELLLTLAVVAILVSLAYSSYERFILRSRNAVAAAEIQTISGCLDRYVQTS